uniref:Ion_trans domain-containing protein n=1 Tax=Syphacia muris TaxID=451379 RepID=A0A0N5B002_9BILA
MYADRLASLNNSTVSERIEYRRNQIVNRFKNNQPRMMTQQSVQKRQQIEQRIKQSDHEQTSDNIQPPQDSTAELHNLNLSDFKQETEAENNRNVNDVDDEFVDSGLSYIVKEKLRVFASEIRKRTSKIAEELDRDSDLEELESATTDNDKTERRPSLMSFIGLQPIKEKSNPNITTLSKLLKSSINPRGYKYLIWLWLLVTAFLYNALVIPLRSTYPYQTDENVNYWMIADYSADIMYVLDIFLVKPRIVFMRGGIPVVSIC